MHKLERSKTNETSCNLEVNERIQGSAYNTDVRFISTYVRPAT
jgi:hypothetical protein